MFSVHFGKLLGNLLNNVLIEITLNSYAVLQTRKEDFEHKYCHVLQILDSERAGAWQLLQQCQDQAQQLKDLRQEVGLFISALKINGLLYLPSSLTENHDVPPDPVILMR